MTKKLTLAGILKRIGLTLLMMSSLFNGLSIGAQGGAASDLSERQQQATQLVPQSYQLNAMEPEKLAEFYEEMIGLTLLELEADTYYRLGTPAGETLLEIFPAQFQKTQATTGLYHTAFLFADRALLGSAVAHLLEQKVLLHGFTDHNVSEAAYLADPEGNGIELYSDTSRTTWRYDVGGYVEMGNNPLDITALLLLREDYNGFRDATSVGHFHLAVNNIAAAEDFYHLVMGLGATSAPDDQTAFFASGGYHHHLGTNTWLSANTPASGEGEQGLRAVIWQTESETDLDYIVSQLEENGYEYDVSDEGLRFQDAAGIIHIVQVSV